MTLKELRLAYNISQKEAALAVGISLRSYIMYENDANKKNTLKYKFIYQELERIYKIDEEHGLLTLDNIQLTCDKIFSKYKINYCYLFGSYAKGNQKAESDVDLLISSDVKGLKFFGLAEKLREQLHKKVDLLDVSQLVKNPELLDEILKYGIKIYG